MAIQLLQSVVVLLGIGAPYRYVCTGSSNGISHAKSDAAVTAGYQSHFAC
jgi:hypothetical protein